VEIDATAPGRLVLRDTHMDGWSATVDGNLATIGGTTWLELDLPAGTHKVRFSYTAPGWAAGIKVFCAGLLAVLLLAIAGWLPRKSQPVVE
jgi:uncharacterized membrane protein YfhO